MAIASEYAAALPAFHALAGCENTGHIPGKERSITIHALDELCAVGTGLRN